MAIALSVGVVIAIYVTIGRRAVLRNLLIGCLLLFAAIQVGFWYLVKFQPERTWQYPGRSTSGSGSWACSRRPRSGRSPTICSPRARPSASSASSAPAAITGLDLLGSPRRGPGRDEGARHREPAARDGDRCSWSARLVVGPLAREGAVPAGGTDCPTRSRRRRVCARAGGRSSRRRTSSRSPR